MRCDEALGLHWEEREEFGVRLEHSARWRGEGPVHGQGLKGASEAWLPPAGLVLARSRALTAPSEGLPGSPACPSPQVRSPDRQGTRSEPSLSS